MEYFKNRKTIAVNGRTLMYPEFLSVLDNMHRQLQFRRYNRDSYRKLDILQIMSEDYCDRGKKEPSQRLKEELSEFYLKTDRGYPESIEDIFLQVARNEALIVPDLDRYEERSRQRYLKEVEAEEREKQRLEQVALLAGHIEESERAKKIAFLQNLLHTKINCDQYHVTREESEATEYWCKLLMVRGKTIPWGLVKEAHERCYLEEHEIEELLHEGGFKHDYEWYSEDKFEFTESTVILTESYLKKCEPTLRKITGYYGDV